MAISITQSPVLPDMSNKDLLYLVSSTQTSQPQFQYVCDINDASGTLIQRIKQQPNPAGKAVFNIGQIITNQLEFDLGVIKTDPNENTTGIYADNSSNRIADNFQIRFGEEYGTSVSSSVTLYTGVSTNTGNPAVNAQTNEFFFQGVKDYNRLPNAYTFISGSQPKYNEANSTTLDFQDARRYMVRFALPNTGDDPDYLERGPNYLLTGYPSSSKAGVDWEYSVRRDEYQTVSFFNGYIQDANSPDGNNDNWAQDIAGIKFATYDSAGSQISGSYYLLNSTAFGGGPRTATHSNGLAANIRWEDVKSGNGPDYNIITLNLGYPNVDGHTFKTTADGNTDITANLADAAYYEISLLGYNGATTSPVYGLDPELTTIRVNILEDCNYYDSVRFAWKNEFGVWDWYTATLAEEAVSGIERLSFEREVINYSSGNQINFNSSAKGTENYLNKITRSRAVNTDWLTDTEAEWLRELFFSTEVFIQDFDNNRMLPVVIDNASVTEKTNPRSQKLFQYRIEFRMANDLTSRQG